MEWVETTGKSVEEAKSIALDRLGVADEDAEFEILDEPKPGLFGRVRGEARVRARVKPKSPRAKNDRRDRGRRSEQGPRDGGATRQKPQKQEKKMSDNNENPRRERADGPPANPAEVAAQAEKFLLGLANALGSSATAESVIEGDDIEVHLHGAELGLLVGPRGSTLQAVQDITRVVAQRRMGDHDTRLRIDVGGYRAKRKEALGRFVNQVADEVVSTGTPRALEAMPSPDRKIVHDALNGRTDIATHSEGEDPHRRVVITPANTTEG
jgi:spoIIIJ-associated protein